MKKILFFAVAVLLSASTFAQSKATEDKTESKTLEFMSRGSSLIKKEFYDLESVKGVECKVLIVTDLLENKKIGCLRLETTYTGYSTSDTYIGTLDYDEIDDCIKSINYIDCFIKSCDAENDKQLINAIHNWLSTEIYVPYEIITIEYINFATGQKYRIV